MKVLVISTVVVCLTAWGQQPGQPRARRMAPMGPMHAGMGSMAAGQVVKNAPYSAVATIEVNRTLSDGTKIHRTASGVICRDSQGRVRNEVFSHVGAVGATGETPKLVLITDPVAGVTWVLDPVNKTARRGGAMAHRAAGMGMGMGEGGAMKHAVPGGTMRHSTDAKTESLGTKTIDGVQAEGTRSIVVIPAGEIGNDKPLQVVHERWYAPHLQIPVVRKSSDPRLGENSYTLTKITQGEPDAALFQVPADYTVIERGAGAGRMQRMRAMRQR